MTVMARGASFISLAGGPGLAVFEAREDDMEVREGCGLQSQLQLFGAQSFTPTESSQIAYR
jgi:hypothetical protein